MSRIPLKYHTNIKFYTQYTHPTLICRGTDGRTDGWTDGRMDGQTENIYSIFRDKLLLLGEHVLREANKMASKPSPPTPLSEGFFLVLTGLGIMSQGESRMIQLSH
jgi:hypothetical protein